MCQHLAKGGTTQTAGGENCPAYRDGIHHLFPGSMISVGSDGVTLLRCSCQLEFTLHFRGVATVAQLALPFWMALAMAGRGHMTAMDLFHFAETYRNDMLSMSTNYPIAGYDT